MRRFSNRTLANNMNKANSRGETIFPNGDTSPNSPGFSPKIYKIVTVLTFQCGMSRELLQKSFLWRRNRK